MSVLPSTSLANTLVLALSQCQEQIRTIQEHSSRIDQLQRENERLRKELQDTEDKLNAKATVEESSQTQELFQKHVEAQAEIQTLKRKIRSYKEKASKKLSLPLSSPLSAPVTPVERSPKQSAGKRVFSEILNASSTPAEITETTGQDKEHRSTEEVSEATFSTPPRKRARPDPGKLRDVLKEVSNNTTHARFSSPGASKRSTILQKVAAIPLLAEDGEEHAPNHQTTNADRHAANRDDSMYHRLDGLLAGSTPVKPLLTRPGLKSPRPYESPSTPHQRKLLNISNIQHATSEVVPALMSLPQTGHADTKANDQPPEPEHKHLQTTASHKTQRSRSPIRRVARLPKISTPLREQPACNLMMSSFKPNPRWLSSHNVSYDDFLNDRQYERMRTLATTLPHLPGETRDHHFTDHELLLEFLGPGSESRIANLTPVARRNLIIEAKTRRVAQQFKLSKPAVNVDTEQDGPPGFWSTDMPDTQEAEENKEASRRREQEEITRRYEDAMSGQGRWVFADE